MREVVLVYEIEWIDEAHADRFKFTHPHNLTSYELFKSTFSFFATVANKLNCFFMKLILKANRRV